MFLSLRVEGVSLDWKFLSAVAMELLTLLKCKLADQQEGPGLVSIPDLIRSIRTTQVRAYSIVKHPRAVEDSRQWIFLALL